MQCRYCGREVRMAAGKLVYNGSPSCKASPTGSHVSLPVPGCCIYCGRQVKPGAGGTLIFNGSPACLASPSKKHSLL